MVTYFLLIKNEHRLKDLSLGLLFLAIAFRISKSVIYYVFSEISNFGIGVGVLGFASIGPLLYFYFKFSKEGSYTLKLKDILHFVFGFAGFITITFFDSFHDEFFLGTKLQMAIYLIYIGRKHIFVSNDVRLSKWHNILFYSMVCILIVFTFQFFVGSLESYTIGTALASLIIYILFFVALKTPSVIKKNTPVNLPQDLLDKIKNAIETDKIYTQPAITLAQFSEIIETPNYLVSKATKKIYNKSFPEAINSFRINDLIQKLTDLSNTDKIEDLAFDVGFNTSSAFYNAFKKETSMSPREYQKKVLEKEIN